MNQRSNIDLLALMGAELVSVNKNGKKMNCDIKTMIEKGT